MRRVNLLWTWAFMAAAIGAWGQSALEDSLSDAGVVSEWRAWSEHQWASNAAPKWAMAGVAFGGDISSPVRTLVSLTEQKGHGVLGGTSRTGVSLTLPALELFPEPDQGRWETFVALENRMVAAAEWSPAAARFAFGRWGLDAPDDRLGGTAFSVISATCLKIGGVRTSRTEAFAIPMDLELHWAFQAGEVHRYDAGRIARDSRATWDEQAVDVDLYVTRGTPLGVGTLVGVDVGIALEEADGGQGRPDRWSLLIQDISRGRFRALEYSRLDTAFNTPGFPLLTAGAPDFSAATTTDTLSGDLAFGLPATVTLRWERRALRDPDVRWVAEWQRHGYAPRGRLELTRIQGLGRVRTAIGLGFGGWGGAYIPLRFEMPSREVRQGRPGGTLTVATRWLALPGTGGRMALALNWHRTF